MLTPAALAALSGGFAVGAGLILSIGPQNLHLIRAGAHAGRGWVSATVGYSSEIVIFLAAITWLAAVLNRAPEAVAGLYALGIAFLLWCGLRTLWLPARRPGALAMKQSRRPLRSEVLGILSVTWLNPLVYLEVGLVAGTFAVSQQGDARIAFALGFLTASALRFYGWSMVGQRLGPWLAQGGRMRWFNILSGAVLIVLAMSMVWHALAGGLS